MTDIVVDWISWYNFHSREDTPYRNRIRSNSQLNSNMNTSPILTFLHNDTESNEAFNLAVRLTSLWYKTLCKRERHYHVKWCKAFITVKPWPNGLAEVDAGFRLEFDLRWLWSSSNSYASRHKFFTVWPPNASRHKLIASELYIREI